MAMELAYCHARYDGRVTLEEFFVDVLRFHKPFSKLMSCDAGRKTILEVVNQTVAQRRLKREVAAVIANIVHNGWCIHEGVNYEPCIMASMPMPANGFRVVRR